MKRKALLFCFILVITSFCSCDKASTDSSNSSAHSVSSTDTTLASDNNEKSVSDIMKKILEDVTDTNVTVTVNYNDEKYTEYFEYLYDLKISVICDGSISYASTGGYADEISILKSADSANVSIIKSAMEERIERRIKDFNGYKPDEVAKLEKAAVFTDGNYIVLAVCDNTEAIHSAFDKAIKEEQ